MPSAEAAGRPNGRRWPATCCTAVDARADQTLDATRSNRSIGSCSIAAAEAFTWLRHGRTGQGGQQGRPDRRGAKREAASKRFAAAGDRRRNWARRRRHGVCSRSTRCATDLDAAFRGSRLLLAAASRAQGRPGRRRNGTCPASARLEQHLHAADHQSHRNALDRRPHRHRRQGVWRRSGHDRPSVQRRSRRRSSRSTAPAT